MIHEALEKHEQKRMRHPIDDRGKNVVMDLFEEPHEQARTSVQTHVFISMGEAVMKAVFTEKAYELLNDNMYQLNESQDFTEGLIRHLKRASTFTVPVKRFVKQQTEKVVASETKVRPDVKREEPLKRKNYPNVIIELSPSRIIEHG